jgi:antitoxin HicB
LAPAAQVAAKLAVWQAWRASGISKSELARRLGLREGEARRILDPDYATSLPRLEAALQVLGRHFILGVA